jgi:hypothetical protein
MYGGRHLLLPFLICCDLRSAYVHGTDLVQWQWYHRRWGVVNEVNGSVLLSDILKTLTNDDCILLMLAKIR